MLNLISTCAIGASDLLWWSHYMVFRYSSEKCPFDAASSRD